MHYNYTVGDRCVVRLDITNEQRMGSVQSVDGAGAAVVWLRPTGAIKLKPDGQSFLGLFTLIKHVPYADFLATGKCNV